jgi:exopolyphosphatase/guanosine-5'-triphosphate,3'-diphosphate pyrophosphatase
VIFSSWGLREGTLFAALDDVEQAQDPLLAGIAAFAAPMGGTPSRASHIARWTLLPSTGSGVDAGGTERIRLAATMLSLAAMAIEPNLRLREAYGWALQKRWIDCTATHRAMIAAALVASCGGGAVPDELTTLAPQEALDEAFAWGLALRLCRRLGANSPAILRETRLMVRDNDLVLRIAPGISALEGPTTMKDLGRVADALGLSPRLEFTDPHD